MAKLGQQLQEKEDQAQGRISRTQRVARQQAIAREQLKFKQLQERAEQVRQEKFKDKVVDEIYYETVPDWDKIKKFSGNTVSEYNYSRMSDSGRKAFLKWAGQRNATKQIKLTRQKTIPFTLEDQGDQDYSYKDVYETLDPELKQFFQTPDEVVEAKYQRIDDTKQEVLAKIKAKEQEKVEAKQKYDQKIKDLQDWWSRKSRKYRDDPKNKQRMKDKENKYEDDYEEDLEEIRGEQEGLQKGLSQLENKKDIDYQSIWSYAQDLGNYYEDRERARNDARNEFNEKKASGELDEAFKQLGVSKDISYYKFKNVVKDYNKTVPKANQLAKQGLKPIYVGGKITGYEDAVLGMSYSVDAYNKQFKEQRSKLDISFDEKTNMLSVKPNPDIAYKEYLDQKKPTIIGVPYNVGKVDFNKQEATSFKFGNKTYIPTSQIKGYVDQGTISTMPQYMEVSGDVDLTPKKTIFDKAWDWTKTQYQKIPSGDWVYTPIGLSAFGTGSKYEINLTEKIGDARDWLQSGGSKTTEDLGKIESVAEKTAKIDEYYQEQGQARFENLYAKDIIYGDLTPEEAEEKFKETDSYKEWQSQYAEDYGVTFDEAIERQNIGWGSALKYGSKQFAYGTGDFLLGRIETPKKTIETGAVVGGVVATYGSLSPAVASAVGWTLTGASIGYGAYKTFDPKSSPSEVFGGAVMLGIGTATAGYGLYRYLKSPVVKTVKIKPPKADLKASATKGYDVKFLTKDGTVNKVIYKNQKLSQVGVAGRRTTVTTKWRALSNKYLNTNLKNIYEGIPTQQLAQRYVVTDALRGTSTTVTVGKSGYQKAYDLLTKYGYTKYQATATLRYTAPRVYENYLRSGVINVQGNKAIGGLNFETVRPVIDVDDALGIKTRGGGTIRDYVKVERALLQNKAGEKFVLESLNTKTYGVNLKGVETFKQLNEKLNIGRVWASDTKTGLDVVGKNKLYNIYEKVSYRDALSINRPLIDATGKVTKTGWVDLDIKLLPKDLSASRTILIDKIKDLRPTKMFVGSGAKTPFSKTFGMSDKLDDVANQLRLTKPTPTPTPSKDVAKVIDKLDDIGGGATRSQYYGQGVYERTDAMVGFSPQQTQALQNQLKVVNAPDVRIAQLKNLIKIDAKVLNIDAIAGLQAGTLGLNLKASPDLKTDLKVNTQLKNLIKEDVAIKTDSVVATKTSPALKTQLKTLLDLNTAPITTTTPSYRLPTPPTPTPPIPKPFIIPFLKAKTGSKVDAQLKKQLKELAYLPDFTSRALGLKAEKVTQKQAQKRLNKLLTGLELRRGVQLK